MRLTRAVLLSILAGLIGFVVGFRVGRVQVVSQLKQRAQQTADALEDEGGTG